MDSVMDIEAAKTIIFQAQVASYPNPEHAKALGALYNLVEEIERLQEENQRLQSIIDQAAALLTPAHDGSRAVDRAREALLDHCREDSVSDTEIERVLEEKCRLCAGHNDPHGIPGDPCDGCVRRTDSGIGWELSNFRQGKEADSHG